MHSNKLHFEVNIIGIINQNFKRIIKIKINFFKKIAIKKRNHQTFESTKLGGGKKTSLSINNMRNLRTEKQKKRKTHNS
jgi:hypothetical protein